MPTIKENLKAISRSVWHSVDVFSHKVLLLRHDGGRKYFNATLEIEKDVEYADRDLTMTRIDRVKVMCARDDVTGLTSIRRDDKVVIPASFFGTEELTEDERTFIHFGDVEDKLTSTWTLIFHGRVRERQGPG